MKYPILAVAAALALASCSSQTEILRSYSEAGSLVDTGSFGNATMNNTQIMTGEKSYAENLSNRFANKVPTMVNFAFDSSQLDANARSALNKQASFIRQYPEVRFRVYGHTDAVGSERFNLRLSRRRARACRHSASYGSSP